MSVQYDIWNIINRFVDKQANSKNCGPPPGNRFDIGVGQRSRSRSLHGINRKGLSQGSCMPNINALSLILQKIWARLKFLWQRDWQTDGQTDGRMSFNIPRFRERRGTIRPEWQHSTKECMCGLWNTARDYQEKPDYQKAWLPDRRTDRCRTKWSVCVAILHRWCSNWHV